MRQMAGEPSRAYGHAARPRLFRRSSDIIHDSPLPLDDIAGLKVSTENESQPLDKSAATEDTEFGCAIKFSFKKAKALLSFTQRGHMLNGKGRLLFKS